MLLTTSTNSPWFISVIHLLACLQPIDILIHISSLRTNERELEYAFGFIVVLCDALRCSAWCCVCLVMLYDNRWCCVVLRGAAWCVVLRGATWWCVVVRGSMVLCCDMI